MRLRCDMPIAGSRGGNPRGRSKTGSDDGYQKGLDKTTADDDFHAKVSAAPVDFTVSSYSRSNPMFGLSSMFEVLQEDKKGRPTRK